MMTKVNDSISDILDIDKIEDKLPVVCELVDDVQEDNEIQSDMKYARKNIKNLINKGTLALDSLLNLAKESEQPRAYEVISTLMRNISDMNKDLMELQKRKKDLVNNSGSRQQNINVDKAVVFTGSTTELVKLIKQQNMGIE